MRCDLRSPTATGADATGTCAGPVIAPSTTASDLCANNVESTGRDTASTQHMTTHTLGLGALGRMVYSNFQNDLLGKRVYIPDYWLHTSGDFFAVASGSVANPSGGLCTWMTAGKASLDCACANGTARPSANSRTRMRIAQFEIGFIVIGSRRGSSLISPKLFMSA